MDEKKTMDTYIRESAEALKNMLFHMPDEVEKLKDLYVGSLVRKYGLLPLDPSYNGLSAPGFLYAGHSENRNRGNDAL